MLEKDKIKIEEIGIDYLNNGVVMKGTKKSVLTKKDVYSGFVLQENNLSQLNSIMDNSPNEDNKFIKDVLDMTGEKIKGLYIDKIPKRISELTSTLELSNEKLNNVSPSAGVIYALIGNSDIYLDKKIVFDRKQTKRKQREFFDGFINSICFKDVEDLYDNVKGYGNIDFDKKGYNKLEIDGFGGGKQILISPFLPMPSFLKSVELLVYKFNENTYYAFFSPRDAEILDSLFEKVNKKQRPTERIKLEYRKLKSNSLFENLSVMKRILEKNGYKVNSVYIDGEPGQQMNEKIFLYKPEHVIVNFEKDKKTMSLRGSSDFGVGLSVIYSDDLWLKEKKERNMDLDYIR